MGFISRSTFSLKMLSVCTVLGCAESELLCLSTLNWAVLQGKRIFLTKEAFLWCLISLIENEEGLERCRVLCFEIRREKGGREYCKP